MARIATTIGKKTIATHVESKAILKLLTKMNLNIDYAQGFHLGKPARLITDKKLKISAHL